MPPEPPLSAIRFTATAFEWRGPAPYLFAAIPDQHSADLRYAARHVSYGWGVIPVTVQIGRTRFTTSLFPRGGGYLLPLKLAVQRTERLVVGRSFAVRLAVMPPEP